MMDITIPKRALLSALDKARAVADRGSAMPILRSVLLSATQGPGGNTLTVSATDFVLSLSAELPCAVKAPGSVAAPAQLLRDVVSRMGDGDVRVTYERGSLAVRGTGARSAGKLPAVPGEDFPEIPTAPKGCASRTIPAVALADVLRLTRYAQSTDTTRPHLSATLLALDGAVMRAVTTDGYRMSLATREVPAGAAMKALLPRASLDRVKLPNAGDVAFSCASGAGPVWLSWGDASPGSHGSSRETWSTKLVDASFPSYEQVIPAEWSGVAECDRAALLDAVNAVATVALDRTGGIRVRPRQGGGKLRIDSENPDAGEMADEIDADLSGALPAVWGVNARYLADMLSALSGERVKLCLSDSLDPVRVECCVEKAAFVGVIMPMRTGEE